MQITELTVHPTNEGLLRAYANIDFDNCFMIREIRVIEGPTGLLVSFPAKKQSDGTHRGACLSGQCENPNHDPAGHTGGVRENRWRKGPSAKRSLSFRTSKST